MKSSKSMRLVIFLFACFTSLLFSCEESNITPLEKEKVAATNKVKCLYESKADLLQRKWINTYTVIDEYDSNNILINTTTINPIGYFELKADFTYSVLSDGVGLDGSWKIDSERCFLILDCGKKSERAFQAVVLTGDSLTIRRKEGSLVYTQHYKFDSKGSESCLIRENINLFTKEWRNTFTIITYYNEDGSVSFQEEIRPVGYFKVNCDRTYNVLSDGVSQDGNWLIDTKRCKLVLDSKTNLERSFEFLKLNNDSLVIFRKEDLISYTQHYSN